MDATSVVLHSARATARALGVPLSQILKAVKMGLVRPIARSSSGEMLFSPAHIAELARHRVVATPPSTKKTDYENKTHSA